MMKLFRLQCLILLLFSTSSASAQFIAISGGGLFPQDLSASTPTGIVGGVARADFTNPAIIAVDAGIGFLPFIGVGLHYSHSRPALDLRRADSFGSSAVVDLGSNTITFDARLNTPRFFGFRGYGFMGGGLTRFSLDVESQVEIPFPRGAPGTLTAPIGTFGGGIEKRFFPLLALKLEVRDYVTPIPTSLFQPGAVWHRVAVLGGIVLGR